MAEPFAAARAYARGELQRLVKDMPDFSVSQQFSAEAYNGISSIILEANLDLIDAIDGLGPEVSVFGNLAVHLHRELQIRCCNHYFLAYEQLFGFVDPQSGPGTRARTQAFPVPKWRRAISKATAALQPLFGNSDASVGRIGNATFPWDHLVRPIGRQALSLKPIALGAPITLPRLTAQHALLDDWAADIHRRIAGLLAVTGNKLPRYGAAQYGADIDDLLTRPAPVLDGFRLIITGTLGRQTRTAALRALATNLPVLTMHHGSHYLVFEEPYYPFYEAMLATSICGFGDVGRQLELGTLPSAPNLNGGTVHFHGRTDPEVRRLFMAREGSGMSASGSLRGKTVVYLGVEFSGLRYGPYRDVHPATYLAWQRRLLEWLEQQSGRKPLVRFHPKRQTNRYDPDGYEYLECGMDEALEAADVFVVDYPTTSLAYVAATGKPVLFADIGLRRLHPKALEIVRQRCHHARINVLEPEEGLNALAADLDRDCEDTFTPTFCLGPDGMDEPTSVAHAVRSMI